jgi:hypothetical protein
VENSAEVGEACSGMAKVAEKVWQEPRKRMANGAMVMLCQVLKPIFDFEPAFRKQPSLGITSVNGVTVLCECKRPK